MSKRPIGKKCFLDLITSKSLCQYVILLHIHEEMRRVGVVGVKRGQGTKGKETQNLASVSEENERTSLLLREILKI